MAATNKNNSKAINFDTPPGSPCLSSQGGGLPPISSVPGRGADENSGENSSKGNNNGPCCQLINNLPHGKPQLNNSGTPPPTTTLEKSGSKSPKLIHHQHRDRHHRPFNEKTTNVASLSNESNMSESTIDSTDNNDTIPSLPPRHKDAVVKDPPNDNNNDSNDDNGSDFSNYSYGDEEIDVDDGNNNNDAPIQKKKRPSSSSFSSDVDDFDDDEDDVGSYKHSKLCMPTNFQVTMNNNNINFRWLERDTHSRGRNRCIDDDMSMELDPPSRDHDMSENDDDHDDDDNDNDEMNNYKILSRRSRGRNNSSNSSSDNSSSNMSSEDMDHWVSVKDDDYLFKDEVMFMYMQKMGAVKYDSDGSVKVDPRKMAVLIALKCGTLEEDDNDDDEDEEDEEDEVEKEEDEEFSLEETSPPKKKKKTSIESLFDESADEEDDDDSSYQEKSKNSISSDETASGKIGDGNLGEDDEDEEEDDDLGEHEYDDPSFPLKNNFSAGHRIASISLTKSPLKESVSNHERGNESNDENDEQEEGDDNFHDNRGSHQQHTENNNNSSTTNNSNSGNNNSTNPKRPTPTMFFDEDDVSEEDELNSESSERFYIAEKIYPVSNPDRGDAPLTNSETLAGANWSILAPKVGFDDYLEAVEEARKYRNANPWFKGSCAPSVEEFHINGGDDGDCDDGEDYIFGPSDDPPWDSSDIQNDTRDSEVAIYVMTTEEYKDQLAAQNEARHQFMQASQMQATQRTFQKMLDWRQSRLQMQEAGVRAFYSYPFPQAFDVKADMEVRESYDPVADILKKIRPDAESLPSLMYCGCKQGSLGKFLEDCLRQEKLAMCSDDVDDDYIDFDEQDTLFVNILRHLSLCENVEELFLQMSTSFPARSNKMKTLPESNKSNNLSAMHWGGSCESTRDCRDDSQPSQHLMQQQSQPRNQNARDTISKMFIQKLRNAAPHFECLRVLSFGPSLILHPRALEAISQGCACLERLDIAHALSMEFAGNFLDKEESREDRFPYEKPLVMAVRRLESLIRLDLGNETVECQFLSNSSRKPVPQRSIVSLLIPQESIDHMTKVIESRGGILTLDKFTRLPPWPSERKKCASKYYVVCEMAMDDSLDDEIRQMAWEEQSRIEQFLKHRGHLRNGSSRQTRATREEEVLNEGQYRDLQAKSQHHLRQKHKVENSIANGNSDIPSLSENNNSNHSTKDNGTEAQTSPDANANTGDNTIVSTEPNPCNNDKDDNSIRNNTSTGSIGSAVNGHIVGSPPNANHLKRMQNQPADRDKHKIPRLP